jgi:hypothetical protein
MSEVEWKNKGQMSKWLLRIVHLYMSQVYIFGLCFILCIGQNSTYLAQFYYYWT